MVKPLGPPIEPKSYNRLKYGNQCCTRVNLTRESYLYMFHCIPAISWSDWPFTYNPQLIGQYCNIEPFGLFTSLAKDRSPRFGSYDINYVPQQYYYSVAFARAIRLANTINSLTHYTKGTLSPILIEQALIAYMIANSGSISLVIDSLFTFPSRYSSLSLNIHTQPLRMVPQSSYRLSPIILVEQYNT